MKPTSFYILLTVANLILISVILMPFLCIGLCKREFANQAGLSRHQNGCEVYQTSQALKLERRRAVFHRTKTLGGLDARKARIHSLHVCHAPYQPHISSDFFNSGRLQIILPWILLRRMTRWKVSHPQ